MSEFKPITTQEEFDEAIKERLNRQNIQHRKELDDLNRQLANAKNADVGSYEKQVHDLTDLLNKANDQIKNHEKEIAERDTKIKAYEIGSEKTKIAHEFDLPYEAIGFLRGDDSASIRASAEALKNLVGKSVPPMASGEPAAGGKENQHENAIRNMLNGLNLKGE